ncbi:MAG: hypothetical protein DRQ89_15235 [Epsilonproteobacteria bacterium]|nr:MAG: hypothetical protein DRQ89_15235 [Campylobacterota bacterium]
MGELDAVEPLGSEDEAFVHQAALEEVAFLVRASFTVTQDQQRARVILAQVLDRLLLLELDLRGDARIAPIHVESVLSCLEVLPTGATGATATTATSAGHGASGGAHQGECEGEGPRLQEDVAHRKAPEA